MSLRVVDFEIAPRLFNLNAWAYAGGYQMDGDGISEFGEKGGVRGYLTNDLVLDVGVTDDDQFGTNTVVQVIWTPGRTTADSSSWSHNIDDRMREQVYRNAYVAVDQTAGSRHDHADRRARARSSASSTSTATRPPAATARSRIRSTT